MHSEENCTSQREQLWQQRQLEQNLYQPKFSAENTFP